MNLRICTTAALILLLGLLITPVGAKDVNSNAGTSAFPFLKVNVGARPVSMGGAFTGLANDETALYYNPAGITSLEGTRFIFGYHNYFVDMQSGFLGMVRPFGYDKAIGGYISYLNYGDMTETDQMGNVLGEFGGGDWVLGLTFAMKAFEQYQFGGTVKFIYESLHDYSATGVAVDLGARWASDRERYTAGLMIQNLGVQLSSLGEGDKDNLPLTFRGGVSTRPRGLPVVFALDLILPTDNDLGVALGGEYYELRPFFVRAGWNSFGSNYRAADSDDNWAGMSLGAGFRIDDMGILKNAEISYSYSPAADLGESHRITLTGGSF